MKRTVLTLAFAALMMAGSAFAQDNVVPPEPAVDATAQVIEEAPPIADEVQPIADGAVASTSDCLGCGRSAGTIVNRGCNSCCGGNRIMTRTRFFRGRNCGTSCNTCATAPVSNCCQNRISRCSTCTACNARPVSTCSTCSTCNVRRVANCSTCTACNVRPVSTCATRTACNVRRVRSCCGTNNVVFNAPMTMATDSMVLVAPQESTIQGTLTAAPLVQDATSVVTPTPEAVMIAEPTVTSACCNRRRVIRPLRRVFRRCR